MKVDAYSGRKHLRTRGATIEAILHYLLEAAIYYTKKEHIGWTQLKPTSASTYEHFVHTRFMAFASLKRKLFRLQKRMGAP